MSLRTDVSVLYVDPRGPYPKLVADWWDEKRDARLYAGPNPVVAHPPCSAWCQLAPLNQHRYGHKVGADAGCFSAALASVRAFGGVLEHPAYTYAWRAHGLIDPVLGAWCRCLDGGWVTVVSQAAFGHRARKLTWLYYFGNSPPAVPSWDIPAHTAIVSKLGVWVDPSGRKHGSSNPNKMNSAEAKRTPVAFATWLIDLAAQAKPIARSA